MTGAGFGSLPEALGRWALAKPDETCLITLAAGVETERLSFGTLDAQARRLSARLRALGAAGRPVLLFCPPGAAFVVGFCACLHAGAIAAPTSHQARNHGAERIRSIIGDAQPVAILRSRASPLPAELLSERLAELVIEDEAAGADADFEPFAPAPDAPAFLQYTSGSTGHPKGVVVTHGGLAANLLMLQKGFGVHAGSRLVTWLPLFHDMGLIGHVLLALYSGVACVVMPPADFIRRPERWLKAISDHGGTISGAPNFAFDLCVRSLRRMTLDALDLSRWETAFCGAEPIRPETMTRFAEAFALAAFRPRALYPCYGLAEATLFVSGGPRGGARITQAGGREVVACGEAAEGETILIVDPDTGAPVPDGSTGEIWIAGPHVAAGYWGRAEETRSVFGARLSNGEGPFLRSGDLGFLRGGQLHINGRLKDLIIHQGRNIHPEDIEETSARSLEGRGSVCAAFSVEVGGVEQIVVVQEVARSFVATLDVRTARHAIAAAVAAVHGAPLLDILLVRPGAVARTTSGKIQRAGSRRFYLDGAFERAGAVLGGGGRRAS